MESAFTLIELLVVISIVAVLSGLITAGVLAGIGSARNAGCVANLSQIGHAEDLYAADHDNYLPPFYLSMRDTSHPKADINPAGFAHALAGYGLVADQLFCPLDPFRGKDVAQEQQSDVGDHRVTSYLYVTARFFGKPEEQNLRLSLSSIPKPSLTMFVTDRDWWMPDADGKGVSISPHNDRSNVLYVDWHVKSALLATACAFPGYGPNCPD